MAGSIDLVVFGIPLCIEQAVAKKRVEVKIHLFRAKVCFGHYVRLLNPADCGDQNIVYNVKLASVL